MSGLAPHLQRVAEALSPHRDALVESWIRAVVQHGSVPEAEARALCTKALSALLERLSRAEVEGLFEDDAREALAAARAGASFGSLALGIRVLNRCCLPFLLSSCPEPERLPEWLLALDDLGSRRLEILLQAQEEESARRLIDAQEQAARASEKAREVARVNEALSRAQRQSQHRAEQIALLASVAHKIAPVLDPEQLLQVAAETIQARLSHTYVGVVVLDDEGVLVGRWAGRPGVGRRSGGRAQGPPGGIIGRALRQRAPQVVGDVTRDADYHPDVPGTRSEMVVPLLEGGAAVGAIDFQSERAGSFDLDDVAAGEALGEFLVVALRNARLYQEARRSPQ